MREYAAAAIAAAVAFVSVESGLFLLVAIGALASLATLFYVLRLGRQLTDKSSVQTQATQRLASTISDVDTHIRD